MSGENLDGTRLYLATFVLGRLTLHYFRDFVHKKKSNSFQNSHKVGVFLCTWITKVVQSVVRVDYQLKSQPFRVKGSVY